MGLVDDGVLWTVRKAVYGLRVSPRAWGQERDRQLRKVTWMVDGHTYALRQCQTDTQVWKVIRSGPKAPVGPALAAANVATGDPDGHYGDLHNY